MNQILFQLTPCSRLPNMFRCSAPIRPHADPRSALLRMDLQQRLDLPSHFGIIVCSRMINPTTGCSLDCVLTRQPFWKITSRKTSSCNYFSFIYGRDKSASADIYGSGCWDLSYLDWRRLSRGKIIIVPGSLWSLPTFPWVFELSRFKVKASFQPSLIEKNPSFLSCILSC